MGKKAGRRANKSKKTTLKDLPPSTAKTRKVKGGGFSIGKVLGSVISAPFKA